MKMLRTLVLCLTCLATSSLAFAQDDAQERQDVDARLAELLKRFPDADANKDGVLTLDEARTYRDKRRAMSQTTRAKVPPTHADVAYGEHAKQRFDLWTVPDAKEPTPLVIFIHGGGFRGGDKSGMNPDAAKVYLNQGVAFASLNYRLSDAGPYPIMMHDAARALQTIRHRAKEWNIDPQRIVCFGGSAGAGISLWLAFHDDLADPKSEDPIARESTRILAAGTMGGQSTYDLFTYREWFGVPDLVAHDALPQFYGLKNEAEVETDAVRKLMKDASPITHLSNDDKASVYMTYSQGNVPVTVDTPQNVWVHHVLLGLKLKEAMDKQELECIVTAPGVTAGKDPYGSMTAFLIKKAKGE
ncbi:alpha/beta hydrolase [Blastopirellula sp. JC732]|uniref:Alpha/beta hydrolase n=1 Tax=Blastopirellula sediminis TaxID=2894196 RepID=A0A9X1MIV0_9BACT|nr:alpha/beta hydrolase [Blastopirellula sediminis]MCC9609315.1 alpha/beta hydrolase [Blastopirellula sediminis]MCC9627908.1 alpha/beta hydrolase [Blastopirellula sediminis]